MAFNGLFNNNSNVNNIDLHIATIKFHTKNCIIHAK